MAQGDKNDMQQRIYSLLPPWFQDLAAVPVLAGMLAGVANSFVQVWDLLQFVILQTRIKTATGGFLDMIAWDYFAGRFLRRQSEGDVLFMQRIVAEIIRPRQTVAAIIQMLTDLTGRTPVIYRPDSAFDMGCYNVGTMGYGMGLGYGSLSYPTQIFITAFRPAASGVANVSGYGGYLGGYGVGSTEYISQALVTGPVLDSEIYARIAQVIAAGTTAWVDIVS